VDWRCRDHGRRCGDRCVGGWLGLRRAAAPAIASAATTGRPHSAARMWVLVMVIWIYPVLFVGVPQPVKWLISKSNAGCSRTHKSGWAAATRTVARPPFSGATMQASSRYTDRLVAY